MLQAKFFVSIKALFFIHNIDCDYLLLFARKVTKGDPLRFFEKQHFGPKKVNPTFWPPAPERLKNPGCAPGETI